MVAEQVTNPDQSFDKKELAAEYETAPPEKDVLGLTSGALELVRERIQVILFHQADRLELISRFDQITKFARFEG